MYPPTQEIMHSDNFLNLTTTTTAQLEPLARIAVFLKPPIYMQETFLACRASESPDYCSKPIALCPAGYPQEEP